MVSAHIVEHDTDINGERVDVTIKQADRLSRHGRQNDGELSVAQT